MKVGKPEAGSLAWDFNEEKAWEFNGENWVVNKELTERLRKYYKKRGNKTV